MCAGVYSKLKAFNVKWWPTYTVNVGFSTNRPHALKKENLSYDVMSKKGGEQVERGSETYETETGQCVPETKKEEEKDLKLLF